MDSYFGQGAVDWGSILQNSVGMSSLSFTKGLFPGKCNTHVGFFDPSPFFSQFYLKQMDFFYCL